MSSIVVAGDVSGLVTLSAPSAAGSVTVTLPASSGTMMVNGPAFSAYLSSAQTLSSSTFTKIQLQLEEWDTANCFDSTTNYRFTPTVAGYYQVNASIRAAASFCSTQISIYKNGSYYKNGNYVTTSGAATTVSSIVYFNGTTDYIELYGFLSIGQNLSNTLADTYFQAAMVRGA